MPLYEFYCSACEHQFEQITSSRDRDQGKCPKCGKKKTRKLISRFKTTGRGDVRETTIHGCHDCQVSPGGDKKHDHNHDHSHDHSHEKDPSKKVS